MNNQNILRTCGICNTICTLEEVDGHACLDEYNKLFVDNNFYFYPLLDDGVTILRCSAVGMSEPIVAEELPRIRRPTRDSEERKIAQGPSKKAKNHTSYDEDELLIDEVKNRPPLWDFTLPLEERGSKITPGLWNEVSVAWNGKLTAVQAKAKFKNLNDAYRRIVQAEDLPIGSATKVKAKKWAHYDNMEFLRDSCLKKPTISNCNAAEDVNIHDEDRAINDTDNPEGDESPECTNSTSAVSDKRKKKNQPSAANAIQRIADANCKPVKEMSLPPMPQPDVVDGCLTMLGSRLRTMKSHIQQRTMQKLLDVSYQALVDYISDDNPASA